MEPTKQKLNVRLLRKIQKHILAEPRRLKMRYWLDTELSERPDKLLPPCGTAGCIAGWALLLSGKRLRMMQYAGGRAMSILGLTPNQASDLFHVENWPWKFKRRFSRVVDYDAPTPTGIAKNAKVTAERIEHFITNRQ